MPAATRQRHPNDGSLRKDAPRGGAPAGSAPHRGEPWRPAGEGSWRVEAAARGVDCEAVPKAACSCADPTISRAHLTPTIDAARTRGLDAGRAGCSSACAAGSAPASISPLPKDAYKIQFTISLCLSRKRRADTGSASAPRPQRRPGCRVRSRARLLDPGSEEGALRRQTLARRAPRAFGGPRGTSPTRSGAPSTNATAGAAPSPTKGAADASTPAR